MKIKQALLEAKKRLLQSNIEGLRPSLESEILLAHTLETTREWLHTWNDQTIDEEDFLLFLHYVDLRIQNTPIEYITKQAGFYGKNFYVDENVLIPRPETELLIDSVDFFIRNYNLHHITEVGVGSGIISIILALKYPSIQITATDISSNAIEVALNNIHHFHTEQNRLKERIKLIQTNLIDNLTDPTDLLISNPPYIANDYPLESHVLLEPHTALFGGEKGHEILEDLIIKASERNIKFLACEIGFDQKEILQEILHKENFQAEFYKDFSGFNRGFVAQKINA